MLLCGKRIWRPPAPAQDEQIVIKNAPLTGAFSLLQSTAVLDRTPLRRLRRGRAIVRPLLDDLVDQAEILGLLGGHEAVALQRVLNRLVVLAGVLNVDLVQAALDVLDLLRVQQNVGGLALKAARWLVDHDAGVRQGETHVLLPGAQQQRRRGSRLSRA